MDEETKGTLRLMSDKLDELLTILKRIEDRQIRTTAMVEDVERKEEQKVQGSFASRSD